MTINRLEGSSSLTITVNLNENDEHGEGRDSTRIFTESKETSHHLIDYPFDFQIRLKVCVNLYHLISSLLNNPKTGIERKQRKKHSKPRIIFPVLTLNN